MEYSVVRSDRRTMAVEITRDARVLVRGWNGRIDTMENASHFIRHLTRIDRYRIYAHPDLVEAVAAAGGGHLGDRPDGA